MANEVTSGSPAEQSTTGLLSGIVSDMGDLIRHEFRFAASEVRADLKKTQEAAAVLALGAGAALLGAILLSLMLVHLLHWASGSPDAMVDAGRLPLWACHGIVGGVFFVTGVVLVVVGRQKLASFNPLPDETVQNVKENVQWIANNK